MYFFRQSYKLKNYLTAGHFNKIAKLLGLVAIVYLYFNLNEFLIPGYKLKKFDVVHLQELFAGGHALLFWGTQLLGLIIPIILLFFRPMRKPLPVTVISLFVLVGSWFKRFIIVVPPQDHPFLPKQNVPAEWMVYIPTLTETAITLATLIMVLIIITILAKTFPVLPIVELAAENDGGPTDDRRPTTDEGPTDDRRPTTDDRRQRTDERINIKAKKDTDPPQLTTDNRQPTTDNLPQPLVIRHRSSVIRRSSVIGRRSSVALTLLLLPTLLPAQTTWTVPDDKKGRLSDVAFTDEMRKSGEQVYLINCKSCHGDPGKNNVSKLVPPPPDPASPEMQNDSDGEIYYKIQEGRGPMPAFKNALTSAEIWQVIAYIRSFNKDYVQQLAPKAGTNQQFTLVDIAISHPADSVIMASVTGLEKNIRVPVPGVEVALLAHRYFGHLRLDEARTTDNSGVVRFRAPSDLPGDTAGMVRLIAKLTDEEQFGAVEKDTTLGIGMVIHPVPLNAQRAMWNVVRKAPVWLLILYPAALLTVLGIVLYILLSVRRIFYIGKRDGEDVRM
jgi:mono/diheme cytochrome c family protein